MRHLWPLRFAFFLLVFLEVGIALSSFRAEAAPPNRRRFPPQQVETLRPAEKPLTETQELKIVEDFRQGDCNTARGLIGPQNISVLRPLLQSVAAFCEVPGIDPQHVFESAEAKNPSDDLIFFLHARYQWSKDPESSKPLFQKVVALARNEILRKIAEDYLEDNAPSDSDLNYGFSKAYYIAGEFSASHETNAANNIALSEGSRLPSNNFSSLLQLGGFLFGESRSYSGHYTFQTSNYPTATQVNLMQHDLDLPISFRVGANQDLTVGPFGELALQRGASYQGLAGIRVTGIAYGDDRKQTVSGSVFMDHFYIPSARNQDGTHYRFDYAWEFFPANRFFRLATFIEHVGADHDIDTDSTGRTDINYSHNDVGLDLKAEFDWRKLSAVLATRLVLREDDRDSTYVDSSTLQQVEKRREDLNASVKLTLGLQVSSSLQLIQWYEWTRTVSNMSKNDYADFNSVNQTVGFGLRAFILGY